MTIAITPLAAEHLPELYRLAEAAWRNDVPDIPFPTEATFAARFEGKSPAHEAERYVALLDGAVAGYLRLLFPTEDNVENVRVDVTVGMEFRRRGVGRALCDLAVRRAVDKGRKNLQCDTTPHGSPFASALGAKLVLTETRSRFDVPPPDQAKLDGMLAGAWEHARGYRLVQWIGLPAEEFLDDVAALDSRLMQDAPTGDLALEPEKVDADRLRAVEAHRVATGKTSFNTGAVHIASGRLVAWTLVSGDRDSPAQTWQQITIVDPEHRGHRLGLLVKLENTRFVRAGQPEVTGIDTINATANEHMLAINAAMGFRPVDQWEQWQLTL